MDSDNERICIVTGATSGIGRAVAEQLVGAGEKVTVTGRRQERLEEFVGRHQESEVLSVPGDIRFPEVNREVVEKTVSKWGTINTIVLSAGIGKYGSIEDYSDEEIKELLDTNLASTIWMIRAALPFFPPAGGDIVIISSVAGVRGGDNEGVYAATKAAQIALAGSLDRELLKRNIRVTTILPGSTETEFAVGAGRTENQADAYEWLRAKDVADAVLFALKQPRSMRTVQWSLLSVAHSS